MTRIKRMDIKELEKFKMQLHVLEWKAR